MAQKTNKKTRPTEQKASGRNARHWVPTPKMLKMTSVALLLVALVLTGVLLLGRESDYLWKVQELNLFLDTKLFFTQQLVVPGGMLTYLGTYFTQYFFHPWQGVTILGLWWLLLMWLTAKTFRIPRQWSVLLLVPVMLLLLSIVTLDYWIYYLKLRGYFFAMTIGSTVAVASVWAYRSLPSRYGLATLWIVLSVALFYPFFGAFALCAAVLMAIMTWSLTKRTWLWKGIDTLIALGSVVLIPHLYYQHTFYQTSADDIYRAGLPLFTIAEEYTAYYLPLKLLALFYVVLAATMWVKRSETVRRFSLWAVGHVLLLALMVWGTLHFWYNDYNFHKELSMQHCIEQQDWEGVVNEAKDLEDEPTRAIVMMKNLALFRLGRQGDEMYHYRTGAKAPNSPIPVHMIQIIGRNIYYNYGHLNFCYRWCLEDGVEFGWRVEYLKYLTRCSLINGEYQVARKYINLLKRTKFHRDWALQQEKFLDNEKALQADKGYGPIFHMMHYSDLLASDQSIVERYLMQHFAMSESDDSLYQEQTLLSALWMKDIDTFWPHFMHYATLHKDEHMPIHYQEAAYLYGKLEPWHVDTSKMPFDPIVIQTYNQFMEQATRLTQQGYSEEDIRDMLYNQFGHTFYFEYYLIRNQKLY